MLQLRSWWKQMKIYSKKSFCEFLSYLLALTELCLKTTFLFLLTMDISEKIEFKKFSMIAILSLPSKTEFSLDLMVFNCSIFSYRRDKLI